MPSSSSTLASSEASASPQIALQRLDDALLNLRRDAALYAQLRGGNGSHRTLTVQTPTVTGSTASSSTPRPASERPLPLRSRPRCAQSTHMDSLATTSSTTIGATVHPLTSTTMAKAGRPRPYHSIAIARHRASVDLPPPREEPEEEHDSSVDAFLGVVAAAARRSRMEDQCAAPSAMLRHSRSFASTQSSFSSIPTTPGDDAPSMMVSCTPSSQSFLPSGTAGSPLGLGPSLQLDSHSHSDSHAHARSRFRSRSRSNPSLRPQRLHPSPHSNPRSCSDSAQPQPPSSFPRRAALNLTLPVWRSKRISKLWPGPLSASTSPEPPAVGASKTD